MPTDKLDKCIACKNSFIKENNGVLCKYGYDYEIIERHYTNKELYFNKGCPYFKNIVGDDDIMDKPKKYVKKPVEIEAILFTENNVAEVMKFMNQSSYDISVYKGTNTISKIVIPTLEGNLEAKIGDYIIKGIKGEFYPCRKDIFDATYEEVKSD